MKIRKTLVGLFKERVWPNKQVRQWLSVGENGTGSRKKTRIRFWKKSIQLDFFVAMAPTKTANVTCRDGSCISTGTAIGRVAKNCLRSVRCSSWELSLGKREVVRGRRVGQGLLRASYKVAVEKAHRKVGRTIKLKQKSVTLLQRLFLKTSLI